jgi:hypothetical protein
MMLSLTLKQACTKQFIGDYMRDHGAAAPSYDAIGNALGLKSKSSVHRLVNGLVDRGHLRHAKGGVRAMQIIEHLCCSNCGGTMMSGPTMCRWRSSRVARAAHRCTASCMSGGLSRNPLGRADARACCTTRSRKKDGGNNPPPGEPRGTSAAKPTLGNRNEQFSRRDHAQFSRINRQHSSRLSRQKLSREYTQHLSRRTDESPCIRAYDSRME